MAVDFIVLAQDHEKAILDKLGKDSEKIEQLKNESTNSDSNLALKMEVCGHVWIFLINRLID